MTLAQLGAEYLEQAKAIRGRIGELRANLKTSRGSKAVELTKRLTSLYSMALDAHRTGIYLINYYGEVGFDAKRA